MKYRNVRILKCKWVAQQTFEAANTGKVTIRTGYVIPVWLAFRCLYCGEYFNQRGAEEHFGKTRSEYNEKTMEVIKETEIITIHKLKGSTIR